MQEVDKILVVVLDKKREEVRDWVIQLSMDQQVGLKYPPMIVFSVRFGV